jgi:four helix bundle protein
MVAAMAVPLESLDIWRVSHELALGVYRISAKFPPDERFGLTSQLRRAAIAIPTNIAEGNARGSSREYMHFCHIARGSLAEVRYLLRMSQDLNLISPEEYGKFQEGYERVSKMLHFLTKAIRRRTL